MRRELQGEERRGRKEQIEGARVNQPIHLFLGGKGLGIQQGMSVWVGLPKSKGPMRGRDFTRFH